MMEIYKKGIPKLRFKEFKVSPDDGNIQERYSKVKI
jgi:hypothetical protein